jgi:hypothetical protein
MASIGRIAWSAQVVVTLFLGFAFCSSLSAQNAEAVLSSHSKLRESLATNHFQAPLFLDSTQTTDSLKGDVYAQIDHPFTELKSALIGSEGWCELLTLHLNVKFCSASGRQPQELLSLVIGRKTERQLTDGYKLDFTFATHDATADYLRVEMLSTLGPFNTRDYFLVLEAVPLGSNTSFIHFSYKYSYGLMARMAMQGYLLTVGRDKIGFSITGKKPDGSPIYIAGLRGAIERNAMRYYLAIQAYLDSLASAPDARVEKRLGDWFSSTETYAAQLHELERNEYLGIKRREFQRQRASSSQKDSNAPRR